MGNVSGIVLALAVVACGGDAKKLEHAKSARYDAELSVLLAETAEVVRQWYRTIEVDPRGTIRTAFQQVTRPLEFDVWYETNTTAERHASRTKYFLRVHISISDTRPARIEVTGHSAWLNEGMTMPSEYRHEDEPRWTSDIADKLRLKIHTRLERFAR